MNARHLQSVLFAAALTSLSGAALANGRHFVWTYESATLPEGEAEVEPWTTARFGKDAYDIRIDNRLEFELGLTDRLMTAFYINTKSTASGYAFAGVSSEWKLNLTSATADLLGFAPYLEGTLAPAEKELEAKLIFDKYLGDWLFALNGVGEYAWEKEEGEVAKVAEAKAILGADYFVAKTTTLGLEAEAVFEFEDDEVEKAYRVGPTLSYASGRYWLALGALVSPWKRTDDEGKAVDWVRARLLLGLDL